MPERGNSRKSWVEETPAEVLFPAQHALRHLLKPPQPSHLYHYARKDAGLKILASSALWASDIRSLSGDVGEYVAGLDVIERQIRERMAVETDPYVYDLIGRWGVQWPRIKRHERFVTSLSAARDLASQWENYAPDGYAFCFDTTALKELAKSQKYSLQPCIYDEFESVCAALIGDAFHAYHFARQQGMDHEEAAMCAKMMFEIPISTISAHLKRKEFAAEAEYRLLTLLPVQYGSTRTVFRRPGNAGLISYECVSFRGNAGGCALREIMVAPAVDFDSARAELEGVLQRYGYSDVAIVRSKSEP